MRLSYASLFPEKAKHAWCKRKRLPQQNSYDLPAGDYCLYDLYPLSGVAEPDIYFVVEFRKQQRQDATLRCLLYGDKAEVTLSPEHLQSPEAPQVCQMVQDLLVADAPLRKSLLRRKQEVQQACQTIASVQDAPESSLLSETAIRKLAGTLEQVMGATEREHAEALLDELLENLRASLLQAFEARQAE